MKHIVLIALCTLTATAVSMAIGERNGKHFQKRCTDIVIADIAKALITFGAFIWGGEIISRRAVNYYFKRKEEIEKEKIGDALATQEK